MTYQQGPAHSVLFDASQASYDADGYDASGHHHHTAGYADGGGEYDDAHHQAYAGSYYDQQQYQQDHHPHHAGAPGGGNVHGSVAPGGGSGGPGIGGAGIGGGGGGGDSHGVPGGADLNNPYGGGLQFYNSQYDASFTQGGHGAGGSGGYYGASGYGDPSAGAGGLDGTGGAPAFEPFPVEVSILAAFGSGGLPGEPPLMEELGINFGHIATKSLTVLNPARAVPKDLMDDADMSGPLIFCLLFGTFLLFSGKVHFGYIYGVGLLGCLSVYFLLNLMSETGLDGYRTTSVLGYSLLPMVLLSSISLLLKLSSSIGYIFSCLAVLWCTYSASTVFVTVLSMSNQRLLVAYPVGLFYTCFALMTVF